MSQASPSSGHLALPFGLALPSPSRAPSPSGPSAASGSGAGASPAGDAPAPKRKRPAGASGKGKIRKRAQAGQRDLADTELNEADDVDDEELIAGPDRTSRALAEAELGYGEGEADEDGEGDEGEGEDGEEGEEVEEEGEGEVEGERKEDGGVEGSANKTGAASNGVTADGDAAIGARGSTNIMGTAGGAKRIRKRQQDTGGIFRPPKKGEELYDEARVKMRLEQQKDTANMLSQVIGPEQAKRFEAFSQASLNRIAIRRLVTAKYDQPLNDTLLRPLAGLGKVFVTEVTELDIQEHSPHPTGPLQPYHLRLAREVLIEQGILGASGADGAARRGNPLA